MCVCVRACVCVCVCVCNIVYITGTLTERNMLFYTKCEVQRHVSGNITVNSTNVVTRPLKGDEATWSHVKY